MDKVLRVFEEVQLPVDAATQVLGFMGKRRTGKTYAAGVFVEELLEAQVQTLVLDQVGNWWALRVGAPGHGAGLDVPVLGGLHGDIALSAEAGQLVADLLSETGRSMVLDVSLFTKAQRRRFCADLGERIWERKKAEKSPAPLHVVLEECQLVVPQRVESDVARMVGVWEEIVRLGGNFGIGVSLLSQRPQSVNKEVLSQAEVVVVFQTNGTHERKALRDWLVEQGGSVDLLAELPGLQVGDAYLWSPSWLQIFQRVRARPKHTLDASATPRVGEKRATRTLKTLDLSALREAMASATHAAEAEDPKTLRARISALERTLADAQSHAPAFPSEALAGVRTAVDAHAAELIRVVSRVTGELSSAVERLLSDGAPRRADPTTTSASAPSRPAAKKATVGEPLGRGPEAILGALASVGTGYLTAAQAGCLSGYSAKSSTFRNYRALLHTRGLVEVRGELLFLSGPGRTYTGDHRPAVHTSQGWWELFVERLDGGPKALLVALLARPGQHLSDETLAGAARSPSSPEGYSANSSTYRNYRARLSTLGLVVREAGYIRLAPTPFDTASRST